MSNVIRSITRAATRKDNEPLNILTFPTHESFESGLAQTGHNFYAYRDQTVKDWNHTYRSLPENYTLLNPAKGVGQFPSDVDFDLVLSQNKFGQFKLAKQFADTWQLPLISLEHTLPFPSWSQTYINQLKQMRGDVNVFISEFSRKAWGWGDNEAVVVHHGIDTECFKPDDGGERQRFLLSVVNDWMNRDWCCGFKFWREATRDLPVYVLGATPGLSQPARNLKELADAYRAAQIFVNTSLVSPIPTALLEAMASGCCVVSTDTCMIPEIIQDGVNGVLCKTPENMKKKLKALLDHPAWCQEMGQRARQTIIEKFNLPAFTNSWNEIFKYTSAIVKRCPNANVRPT